MFDAVADGVLRQAAVAQAVQVGLCPLRQKWEAGLVELELDPISKMWTVLNKHTSETCAIFAVVINA